MLELDAGRSTRSVDFMVGMGAAIAAVSVGAVLGNRYRANGSPVIPRLEDPNWKTGVYRPSHGVGSKAIADNLDSKAVLANEFTDPGTAVKAEGQTDRLAGAHNMLFTGFMESGRLDVPHIDGTEEGSVMTDIGFYNPEPLKAGASELK